MVKHVVKASLVVIVLAVMGAAVAKSAEKDPLAPRVPPDQIAEAKKTKNPFQGNAGALAEGKAIFEGKGTCFTCHGMEGKGNGPASSLMNPKPADFTSEQVKKKSDEQLLNAIESGLPGTPMAPWKGSLTPEQIQDVLAYVRSFGK